MAKLFFLFKKRQPDILNGLFPFAWIGEKSHLLLIMTWRPYNSFRCYLKQTSSDASLVLTIVKITTAIAVYRQKYL